MSWNNSIKQRDKSDEEKFWEKADIKGEDECWEWKASKNRKGYGNFYMSVGHSKDKHCLAHRRSWILTYGEISDGLMVLHHCDNPACVNPKHLFLGNNRDNMNDMVSKGRQGRMAGEKHPMRKLTEEKVLEIRRLRNEGYTLFALGDMFNVHYSTIGYICKGKLWSYINEKS